MKDCQHGHYGVGSSHTLGCEPAGDVLADFLPEPVRSIELTLQELDLLLHFAELGHEMVYQRNAFGDRAVAREVAPVIDRLNSQHRPWKV